MHMHGYVLSTVQLTYPQYMSPGSNSQGIRGIIIILSYLPFKFRI